MLPCLSQMQNGQTRTPEPTIVSAFIGAETTVEADILPSLSPSQTQDSQRFHGTGHLALGRGVSNGTLPSDMSFDMFLFDDSLREWTDFGFGLQQ